MDSSMWLTDVNSQFRKTVQSLKVDAARHRSQSWTRLEARLEVRHIASVRLKVYALRRSLRSGLHIGRRVSEPHVPQKAVHLYVHLTQRLKMIAVNKISIIW